MKTYEITATVVADGRELDLLEFQRVRSYEIDDTCQAMRRRWRAAYGEQLTITVR